MAIVEATFEMDDDGVAKITWPNLLNGDTGAWVRAGRFADKTVGVITNTLGTTPAITIEGSQNGGTDVGELHDPQGGLLSAALTGSTLNDLEVISESPEVIRPTLAGVGSDLTVIITAPTRGK